MGESFSTPSQIHCSFSWWAELWFPRQAGMILTVAVLLPGILYLMDRGKLSIEALAAQFRQLLMTQALLLHWLLGDMFYHFMAVRLDSVTSVFCRGNIMKCIWKKYVLSHHCVFFPPFSLHFLNGSHFDFLGETMKFPILVCYPYEWNLNDHSED